MSKFTLQVRVSFVISKEIEADCMKDAVAQGEAAAADLEGTGYRLPRGWMKEWDEAELHGVVR